MKLLRFLFIFAFLLLPSRSWAALSDNLISYWPLNEASGTRLDKVVASANDLSDTFSAITGNPGKVYSTSSQVTRATGRVLTRADNASVSLGGTAFTYIVWAYFDTIATSQVLISKDDSATNREFQLLHNASGNFSFYTWTGASGAGQANVDATTFGAPSAATWYMIAITNDQTTSKISVNAGTQNSASAVNAGWDGAASVAVGGTSNAANVFDGRIGPAIFWKRALSAAEITQVYNSFSGLRYGALTGTIEPIGLTSGFTSVSTSATTASVTSTTNDLLLLTIVSSGTTTSALSTLSGLGLTWESVRAANWDTVAVPTKRIQTFRAMGNGATGSLTWTITGSDGMAWSLIAFSNCQTGNNGAGAIVQSDSATTNSATSVSVTLSAFGDAVNNVAFGVFGINTTGGITPGSGFIEIHDTSYTSPSAEIQTEWKMGEDLGVDASFASSNDGAMAFEIKKATAGLSPALISAITEDVN